MTPLRVAIVFGMLCVAAAAVLVVLGLQRRPPPPRPLPALPEPDAGVVPVELAAECEPLRGEVAKFPPTREEQIKFCQAWIEIENKPVVVVEDESKCGPQVIVEQLRELDRCAQLNELCDLSKATAQVDVRLEAILGVSRHFPMHITYFDYAVTALQDDDGLRRFVAEELVRDRKRAFMIFGSASPTSQNEKADHRVARARTEAAYEVVEAELRHQRAFGAQTRKASVGRALPEDFCATIGHVPQLEVRCRALDVDSRRQAAFVLSYPRECLAPRS